MICEKVYYSTLLCCCFMIVLFYVKILDTFVSSGHIHCSCSSGTFKTNVCSLVTLTFLHLDVRFGMINRIEQKPKLWWLFLVLSESV